MINENNDKKLGELQLNDLIDLTKFTKQRQKYYHKRFNRIKTSFVEIYELNKDIDNNDINNKYLSIALEKQRVKFLKLIKEILSKK